MRSYKIKFTLFKVVSKFSNQCQIWKIFINLKIIGFLFLLSKNENIFYLNLANKQMLALAIFKIRLLQTHLKGRIHNFRKCATEQFANLHVTGVRCQ